LLAVPQLYRQAGTTLKALVDGHQLCLGHRKHGIDGPHLGDGDDATHVRGVQHIAQIRLAQAQAPGNRRGDARVIKLQPRCIHLRLVGGHRALVLAHQGRLGVHLLAGDGILRLQLLVAPQVQLGVLQQRLVALQRTLGLLQRGAVAARVDLRQQLAGAHLVALLEKNLLQLARHARAHHGGGAGVHGANAADQHAHVAPVHQAHRHRLR